MGLFDDRESAFESKFAHDFEMQFRAEARRDKLVGLWAAELLGKGGADAESYAQDVVRTLCQGTGTEGVLRKLQADLGEIADSLMIRAALADCERRAKAELLEDATW